MNTFLLERVFRDRLDRLLDALSGKPSRGQLETTAGIIERPLGLLKLKVVEFFVAALKSGGEV